MNAIQKTIFIVCVLMLTKLSGQELKRKALLGIQMETLSDSLAQEYNLDLTHGVLIRDIFPNTTASKMNLHVGAVIYEINDQEIHSIHDVLDLMQTVYGEDLIKIKYYEDGKHRRTKGKASPRPKETYANANISYDEVAYDNNLLRSILYLPKGVEKPPVVFYLQGYTCGSIDLVYEDKHPIKKIINDWTDAGFAVYRVEKPGVGDSQSTSNCMEIAFQEEINAFRQAYKRLLKYKEINKEGIFLFGHSMGGIIAPFLASEFSPKGVITYGTTVKSWFEYMIDISRQQGEMFDMPYAEIERDTRRSIPFWYDLLVAKKSNTQLAAHPVYKTFLEDEGVLETLQQGYFLDRHYTYWQELNDVSMTKTWSETNTNVLALYGEFDIQALNAEHTHTIAGIVNEKNPEKGLASTIPNSDHAMAYFSSMEASITSMSDGSYDRYIRENYNPKTAQITIQWIKSQL